MEKLNTNLDINLGSLLREELNDNFKKIQNGVSGQSDLLSKQIQEQLGDVPPMNQNEVTMARIDRNSKEFSTLKGRLDNDQMTADGAMEQADNVSNEVREARTGLNGKYYISLKNRIDGETQGINDNINRQLSLMETAPIPIASLSKLKATYPNGKLGIFVAVDNGHKYVWLNNQWTDAGMYQATAIDSQSITNNMLTDSVRVGELMSGAPVIINTIDRKVSISKVFSVNFAMNRYKVANKSYNFSMSADESAFYLYYDTATQELNLMARNLPKTAMLLGWISIGASTTYNIRTSSVLCDVDNPLLKPIDRNVYTSTGNTQINIDTMNKTMNVDVPYFNVFYPNKQYKVTQRGTIDLDNGSTASFIFYDTEKNKFVTTSGTNMPLPISYLYMGAIDWAYPFNSRLVFPATIDGVDIFNQRQTDKRAQLASKFPVTIDPENKTMNIDNAGWVTLQYDNKSNNIQKYNDGDIDISAGGETSASYIFVNVNSLKIQAFADKGDAPFGFLYLGWYEWNSQVYDLNFAVTFKNASHDLESDYKYGTKQITFFGDSITKADGNDNPWTKLTAHTLGTTATVNGINGTTYTTNNSRPNSAVERVDQIKNQDLVVIWFGVNDFHYGRPLGKFGDTDTSTVYGAADKVYNSLVDNNPTAQIMVMTPMKNHGYNDAPDSFTQNSAGLYQIDYVNAIKQVADKYSLPVLDMYTESGISAFNENHNKLYLKDGLHPNQEGSYRVAKRVIGFINSHL